MGIFHDFKIVQMVPNQASVTSIHRKLQSPFSPTYQNASNLIFNTPIELVHSAFIKCSASFCIYHLILADQFGHKKQV